MKPLQELLAQYNHATKQLNQKKYRRALDNYKKITSQFPNRETYLNMGNCYKFLDQDSQALKCYQLATSPTIPHLDQTIRGPYPLALNNLGLHYYTCGNDNLAIECYNQALAIQPNLYDAAWNKSTAILRCAVDGLEAWKTGWELYQHRFQKTPPLTLNNNNPGLLLYTGREDVTQLLILAEQGIGDAVMFLRYAYALKAKGIKCWIQCNKNTEYLFKDFDCCELASEFPGQYAVPLGSLPLVVPHDIVGDPYLTLPARTDFTPRIGYVYSGSPEHANDRCRTTQAQRFKVFEQFGELVHLNPGAVCGPGKQTTAKNYRETVELLANCDFVVAVDTSIVHVCGALGVPCIMIQPLKETDFRWGKAGRCVWYNSVHIITNNNNWDTAFAAAVEKAKCIKQ